MIKNLKASQTIFSVVFLSLLAIPSYANTGESTPSLLISSLRSFGSLLLIIALIILAAWAAKKYLPYLKQQQGKEEGIKIVAMRALGPKRTVHLIEVEGKKVLIGSTDSGITLLKEFSDLELEK